MSVDQEARLIGITGAFGSGCTTAALNLQAENNFHLVRLSTLVAEELAQSEPHAGRSRQKLQAVGDRIRKAEGRGALVRRALDRLNAADESYTRIVFDGIRNCGEVDELRAIFGFRFALLGVIADPKTRWDRVRYEYLKKGLGQSDFLEDNARDRDEGVEYGQQVAKCIDMADCIVVNGSTTTRGDYDNKVVDMCDVLTTQKPRKPTEDEIYMQMAFTSSYRSACLKRRIGAVIIDAEGEQTSSGYNENPPQLNRVDTSTLTRVGAIVISFVTSVSLR